MIYVVRVQRFDIESGKWQVSYARGTSGRPLTFNDKRLAESLASSVGGSVIQLGKNTKNDHDLLELERKLFEY